MRILVASTAFSDAARRLREGLPGDEVVIDPAADSGTYDVIVPFMGRVDAGVMDRVTPRLIQQFGVGLEGVDREAAAARGIPVANVPAAGTGNSEGVGEIAVLHLLAHPDVQAAGVVGGPSDRHGEEVVAFVSLRPGATVTPSMIVAWAKDRIGGYRYPREVHVLDAVPLTPVGKIDRKALRARLREA